LAAQHKLDEAEDCYREACRLRPDEAEVHYYAASILASHGRLPLAVDFSRRALELAPNDPVVRYLHAAVTGSELPKTAPREYVVPLFDRHSAQFDEQLLRVLEYRGPQLLREAVSDLTAKQSLDILDLGCGTGLCGTEFHELARTLIGVDLSAGMLAQAQARGVYHKLIQGDMLDVLRDSHAAFDLILAADVFIYIGELSDVFSAVLNALRPGGRFVFVVEAHDGQGYVLRPSRRFAHSVEYIRELAVSHGLTETTIHRGVIRKENGCDIDAYVFALQPCSPASPEADNI